jgi:hypothetical protein
MKVQVQDYERMRAWLAFMSREAFPAELLSPEVDPIGHLDRLAKRSPTRAEKGLSIAINDIIEMTDGWTQEHVVSIDHGLQQMGLPTLTEMRGRFSKLVERAVRRGRIKDEVEYHAVRNAAELPEGERLWPLLSAYEEWAGR